MNKATPGEVEGLKIVGDIENNSENPKEKLLKLKQIKKDWIHKLNKERKMYQETKNNPYFKDVLSSSKRDVMYHEDIYLMM